MALAWIRFEIFSSENFNVDFVLLNCAFKKKKKTVREILHRDCQYFSGIGNVH